MFSRHPTLANAVASELKSIPAAKKEIMIDSKLDLQKVLQGLQRVARVGGVALCR